MYFHRLHWTLCKITKKSVRVFSTGSNQSSLSDSISFLSDTNTAVYFICSLELFSYNFRDLILRRASLNTKVCLSMEGMSIPTLVFSGQADCLKQPLSLDWFNRSALAPNMFTIHISCLFRSECSMKGGCFCISSNNLVY